MLRICIFMKLLNTLYSSSSLRTDLFGWLVFTCFGGSLICYVVVMEILHRTGHEFLFLFLHFYAPSYIFYPRFSLSLSSLYVSLICPSLFAPSAAASSRLVVWLHSPDLWEVHYPDLSHSQLYYIHLVPAVDCPSEKVMNHKREWYIDGWNSRIIVKRKHNIYYNIYMLFV